MSKLKNRAVTDGLVHSTYRPRRNNYFAQRCNGWVVHYATDKPLALTCLACWAKEQRHERNLFQRRH